MPPQRKSKTNHGKKDNAVPKKPEYKGKKDNVVPKNHQHKGKKGKAKVDITDIYEASDDERDLARKGHTLDEVDNYEYHVDHVEEEDDEEIDSDEAFDESDDERFESFRFQGSTKNADKKKNKKAVDDEDGLLSEQEIDLNEDDDNDESQDEDEDEEDGEGFVDLSEMLNDDDEEDEKPVKDHKSAVKKLMQGASESEDEDEAMADFMSEDDDDEDDHDEDVVKFIDSLETKKRKRNDSESGKKKQRKEERTEVYDESEFNLLARDSTSGDSKKKLDLSDLMGSMANEDAFASLRKTVLELDGKGKNVAKTALSAPVAKRIQDRADRQIAYQEANKEVTKWEPTVIKNREAEHLSFPLQPPVVSETTTSAALANKFTAQTSMEKQIEEALEAAGMKDKELEEFEALQLNKLSVEEVAARRKELQMMRELMFRHELKARRLKKIKSKSYRKLQRKEKDKQELLAAGLGHEIDEDMTPEEQMKAALERAEERMSLKHKNTSKWAKRALARGQMDEGTREAIMDQLRRGEELRKKVQGFQSDDSGDDSDDGSVNDDNDDEITSEIQKLEREMDADDTQPKKGVFSMKFMQDAAKRNMDSTRAMLDDFKNEWLDEGEDDVSAKKEAESHIVQNNPGRLTFGSAKAASGEKKSTATGSSKAVALNDAGQIKKVSHSAAHITRTSGTVDIAPRSELDSELAAADDEKVSPWLQQVESRVKGKKASKKNNTSKGKIEDKAELSIAKIKKAQKEESDDVQLDLNATLPVLGKKAGKTKAQKPEPTASVKQTTAAAVATSTRSGMVMDSGSEGDDDDEDAVGMVHSSNKLAFAQRELVARAFANDNVTQEFEEEKDAVVEEDASKTEDMTMPGWGDWAGKGLKKKKNKVVRKIEGIDPTKRKDAKLKHVIINEKRNKKTEKYQVTAVPYPYKTMEQYERAMRTPVGKEWNTRNTFQKMTKPKVLTKLGTVIDPLQAPFQ